VVQQMHGAITFMSGKGGVGQTQIVQIVVEDFANREGNRRRDEMGKELTGPSCHDELVTEADFLS
jgi:hypothetical protein